MFIIMKNRYFLFATALMIAMSANAQETYENAKLVGEDLNGTARYVGMGGAMEALGADISTIGTNPAGLGLFRHSNLSVSGGLLMQSNGKEFANGNKTNASFDQIGGVYSTRTGAKSFLNFGFNYHKGKNFDYILNAANSLNGSSQNKQSFIKGLLGDEGRGGFFIDRDPKTNANVGYSDLNKKSNAYTFSQIDYLYWNTLIPTNNPVKPYDYDGGNDYTFNRAHNGYIGNYDFSVSGNLNDRVYLGVTFGIKDVHYNAYSEYSENLVSGARASVADNRSITGSGFDVTAGVIVRPIESSPFRIGAYVKTPTWYDLTTSNTTSLIDYRNYGAANNSKYVNNSYDYKIWTPWKYGFSLGHTIGSSLALGATYEYEDYSRINTRINDGGYIDYWTGSYYDSSIADTQMNNHTREVLKAVSTLKLGVEYKPTTNLALRAGYNYVSPMYVSDGQKDPGLSSLGTSYASATDYTNWKATNRFTLGVGYQIDKFNIDLAYQYSSQSGDFYPFSNVKNININSTTYNNIATGTKVKNDKSQLLLTLGYRF
ncbi:MAG: hemin receptor [Prevotella sp.]|nr:hemin receptor [Prevotella sp.]